MGKTAETLRGLGGALGCSCPSEPRKVTPPPACTEDGVMSYVTLVEKSCLCAYCTDVCYLDVRGMHVVVVGSAGAHCLYETLGRRDQGWCLLMECSKEYLVTAKF